MLLSNLALVHVVSLAAVMQTPVEVSHINTTLLMWFVGIAAAALVLQALILLGMALGGAKIAKELMGYVAEARAKAMPLIESTHGLVKDLTPQIKQITNKVEVISNNVEHISGVAREKVNEFAPTVSAARQTVEEANQTVRDANRQTHQQVERLNNMVTSVLDSTARAGDAIHRGLTMPGREISGVISGVKAAVTTFLGKSKYFGEDGPLGGTRKRDEDLGSPYRAASGSPYRTTQRPQPTEVIIVEEEIVAIPVRPANPAVLGPK